MVQAGVLFPALNYAREIGLDMEHLTRNAQLPADVFATPDHFLPAASWPRLFREITRETGNEVVGWNAAERNPLKYYPTRFNEFSNAPTLLEGLRFVCRANRLFSNNQKIWIQSTKEYAYVCHTDADRRPGYAQRSAFRVGIGMNIIRTFLGPEWYPELLITETSPQVLPDREELDGAKIIRRRGFGAFQIPRLLLSAGSRRSRTDGYAFGQQPAVALSEQIRQTLRSYVADSIPKPSMFAEMLCISDRTFQRRLAEHGTSYSTLVRTARFDVAKELLSELSNPIRDVALHLGFDDQSHFTRFFRQVSGVTPSQYRRSLEEPVGS